MPMDAGRVGADGGEDADDCPTGRLPALPAAGPGRSAVAGTAEQARASDTDVDTLAADRTALIRLCLYALDRARSAGVVRRIEAGLAEVGVTAVRPDGMRFDPAVHEAGGSLPTDDVTLDGVVAETELVGFTDGARLVRAPVVTVYAARRGVRP